MREYELVLMLDPGQDSPARDAVANEVKGQIETAGAMKHENAWGLRKLAYEIAQRNEADYRWFRFEAHSELLEQLDHNLKIADGVLRFRIFKVGPETPVMVPPPTAAPGPAASRERPADSPPSTAVDRPLETPVDPPVDKPTDPPVEAPVDPPVETPVDPPVDAPVDPPVDTPAGDADEPAAPAE